MHFLTSNLFVPTLFTELSPRNSAILLRYFLYVTLFWFISRGTPPIPLREFYAEGAGIPGPVPGTKGVTPDAGALTASGAGTNDGQAHAITPNVWLPILQSATVHPNEHHPKAMRALAHYATLFGTREAGSVSKLVAGSAQNGTANGKAPKFEGLDQLDGTIFTRVGWLTQCALGWMREGEPEKLWDYTGIYPVS